MMEDRWIELLLAAAVHVLMFHVRTLQQFLYCAPDHCYYTMKRLKMHRSGRSVLWFSDFFYLM